MSLQPEIFEGSSASISDEQKAKLKALFPETITEGGKIDFDRLKLTLGESVDAGKERYGMNWPGKADCFKTIQRPSMATLVPARDESVNFDTTENLIIEGDNLETLKLLQKAYLGKVKMIYVDPPYNTGHDFIYPDDYSESLETYLNYSGQVDQEGRKYSTNTDTDGRFHSKWMNMMYPRLFLAHNLLRDDGVIFLSIDDNEIHNLRQIMNEIFGEENFIATVTRIAKTTSFRGNYFAPSKDYLLCYAKHIENVKQFMDEVDESQFVKVETEGPRKGERFRDDIAFYLTTLETRPNQRYFIKCPDGQEVIPPGETFPPEPPKDGDGVWRWSKESYEKKKELLAFKKTTRSPLIDKDGNQAHWNIYTKSYLKDKLELGNIPRDLFEGFLNRNGTEELKRLDIPFDFSKPSELIRYLIKICGVKNNDIVLDFFAGSCTTAHAVLAQNAKEGGDRRFIVVQLPEPCADDSDALKAGYKTIADLGKERVRRVVKELTDSNDGQLALTLNKKINLGFKVFKLQSSNFKAWNTEQPKDDAELVKQLTLHADHLVEGRTQEDVLYELLLKSGFPLDTKVEKITFAEKSVFSIADGAMLICLEKELTPEVIKAMADKKPERVVCLDAGFADNDQLKTNAVQAMKSKGVTKFQTV